MDRTRGPERPTLTSRDQTLLRFVLEGLTNKAIGQRLDVSEGTVKASLRQLFDKLGMRTRAQLVKLALEENRDELSAAGANSAAWREQCLPHLRVQVAGAKGLLDVECARSEYALLDDARIRVSGHVKNPDTRPVSGDRIRQLKAAHLRHNHIRQQQVDGLTKFPSDA